MTDSDKMSGPFRSENFTKLNNLPKSFPLSWDAVADTANEHPFIQDAFLLARACAKYGSPRAIEFLRIWGKASP